MIDRPLGRLDAVHIAGPHHIAARDAQAILRQLPAWFGIESALLEYATEAEKWPNFVATCSGSAVGFLTFREHNSTTAEISCIAVVPEWHGRGVGTRLCDALETSWMRRGGRLLQVKTLGPTRPDEAYARTRKFYEARGFLAVEEFANLWPGIPCLLLVKPLAAHKAG